MGTKSISEKKPRKNVALLVVILVAALGFVLLMIWLSDMADRRRTAQVPVEIVEASHVTWTVGDQQKHGYDVHYRYVVDGTTYDETSEQNEGYDPEASYKVCYNPKDPEDAGLYREDHECGDTLLF